MLWDGLDRFWRGIWGWGMRSQYFSSTDSNTRVSSYWRSTFLFWNCTMQSRDLKVLIVLDTSGTDDTSASIVYAEVGVLKRDISCRGLSHRYKKKLEVWGHRSKSDGHRTNNLAKRGWVVGKLRANRDIECSGNLWSKQSLNSIVHFWTLLRGYRTINIWVICWNVWTENVPKWNTSTCISMCRLLIDWLYLV